MDITKELKTIINGRTNGKKIPALDLIENSPLTSAILSKLHGGDKTTQHDSDGNRKITSPSHAGLSDISNDIAQKATDNENVLQLFQDLKEGLRILINATLAPKDLNSVEVNFSIPPELKVAILGNKLLPIIEKALSKDFKLKEMLPEMLYQILGIDGCYPMLVIPESSVDDMINDKKTVSTESLIESFGNGKTIIKSKGFIGDSDFYKDETIKKEKSISFESIVNGSFVKRTGIKDNRILFKTTTNSEVDTLIRVTDNFDILKFPSIVEIQREQEISKALSDSQGSFFHGFEDFGLQTTRSGYGSTELNDIQLTQLLYKNSFNIRNVTRKIKTSDETERYNIGAPLVKLLPAESVIPVILSGDRRKHLAYFCLLDGLGNALSKDSVASVYEDFRRNQVGFKSGGKLGSHLIQRTADMFNDSCDFVTYQQMQKICTDIIESDFLARLRNGIYGEDVALVHNTDFYDILLSRMFKEQQTQVLFIPAQLLTYFHHELRKNGTGKTLLEDSLTINTLRSVLMFANVQRSVVNSMGKTTVELTIDENDPNKQKTLEVAKHEALKIRQSQALPATISPTDIQQYLQTSQIYFNLNQVPGLPSTALKFSEASMNYVKPDTDLTEDLDKKAILAIGVPPELVANSREVEFATNIVANNLRLSKTISMIQEKIEPHIVKFGRTFCMNHGTVVKEIEKVIKDNLSDITDIKEVDSVVGDLKNNPDLLVKLLAKEFLSNFEIALSRPDTVTLKTQMEAFDEYEGSVDKAINYYLSDDILSQATSGEITTEQISLVRNSVKAYLIRDFLKKNSILPELFDIVKQNEDGEQDTNIFEISGKHANSMTKAINAFLQKVVPVSEASQDDMNKLTGGQELGDGVSSSSSGGGSSSSSSDTSSEEGEDEGEDSDSGGMPDLPDFDSF